MTVDDWVVERLEEEFSLTNVDEYANIFDEMLFIADINEDDDNRAHRMLEEYIKALKIMEGD